MDLNNPVIEDLLKKLRNRSIAGEAKITMACLEALAASTVYMKTETLEDFEHELSFYMALLIKERPRLILLSNAFRYLLNNVKKGLEERVTITELKKRVALSAMDFVKSLKSAIDKIGEIGARYIDDRDVILTHGASTTVLSILAKAKEEGKNVKVIVTEARPELQGKVMSMALADLGLAVTLIVDSGSYHYLNKVHKVLLGATALCPNGCVVGKIGTGAIALAAKEKRVRVYVAANIQKITAEVAFAEEAGREEGDPSWVLPEDEARRLDVFVANPLTM